MIPDSIQKLIDAERKTSHQHTFLKSLKGIGVSKVATLAGSTYETVRNAIDFEAEHLLRRRAIKRILIRMKAISKGDAVHNSEDLVKEIIWGKYTQGQNVPEMKIEEIGKIISKYQTLAGRFHNKFKRKLPKEYANDLYDILSFEIERSIVPYFDRDALINLQYKYLAPLNLVRQPDLPEKYHNVQTYITTIRTVTKFDSAMIKFYMFQNAFPFWKTPNDLQIQNLVMKLTSTLDEINKHIDFKLKNKKYKEFVRQSIPLKFLNNVIEENLGQAEDILKDKSKRDAEVEIICDKEYSESKKKIRKTIVNMVIYLALTKFIFALGEIPLEKFYYGHISWGPIIINIVFPPILMTIIASSFSIPYKRNTQGIIEMIDRYMDPSLQKYVSDGISRERRRPFLYMIFKLFSNFIFLSVLGAITYGLYFYLNFNPFGIAIFILFLCLVSFGALKVRNVATELIVVPVRGTVFTPLIDMIATPILNVGKRLTESVSQFSPLPFIFDYIIESPFKGFIRLFEEWNTYVKEQKEEII